MPQFIAPLIVAGFGSFGVTVSTATATTIAGGVLTAGAVGATLLMRPKTSVPRPSDGSFSSQQAIPPRIYGLGRFRSYGYFMWREERNSLLYQVQAMHDGKIEEYVDFLFGDDYLTVGGDGYITGTQDSDINDGRYGGGHVYLESRLGLDTETEYSELRSVFGSDLPGASGKFRGDGIASIFLSCWSPRADEWTKIYPTGRVELSAIIDSRRVWDPRDPGQDPDDPGTWELAGYDNPALHQLFYECFCPSGPQKDWADVTNGTLQRWKDAANDCDDAISVVGGGTIKRYRAGGYWTSESLQKDVRATILSNYDGWMTELGDGSISVYAGKYRSPSVTLTDADIEGFTLQRGVGNEEVINAIIIKFTSPSHAYGEAEADPWFSFADIAARGITQTKTMDLWWVHDYRQARRLAAREDYRNNAELRGTLLLNMGGLRASGERVVSLSSLAIPELNGLVVEIRDFRIDLTSMTITLDWVSSGPEIDSWTPSEDEGAKPPDTSPVSSSSAVPVPQNFSVVAKQGTISSGQSGVAIIASFDAPTDGRRDLTYVVKYKKESEGNSRYQFEEFFDFSVSSGRINLRTSFVEADTEYEVSVAARAGRGTRSAYTSELPVSTAVNDLATSPPTSFVTSVAGSFSVKCDWTNPSNSNFKGARVYRNTVNNFGSATQVGGLREGDPSDSMTYTNTGLSSGTWYFWVTAENFTGVESTFAGPQSETI